MSAFVVFIGAVISAVAALQSARDEGKTYKQIFFGLSGIVFLGAFISAAGGCWSAYEQEQTDERIVNTITGGDGFAYLQILPRDGYFALLAKNDGIYPLYDLTFSVVDLQALKNTASPLDIENVQQVTTILNSGNLAPNSSKMVGRLNLGKSDHYVFNIVADARNGQTVQELRISKVGDNWKSATRVRPGSKEDRDIYVFEKIDKDFPTDKDGKVVWY